MGEKGEERKEGEISANVYIFSKPIMNTQV